MPEPRFIGDDAVFPIGLGCMNLSHGYGPAPNEEDAKTLLHKALDLGVTLFDTAALYGFGKNETLVGKLLGPHRHEIFLASKCGMTGVDGTRVIDGRPETLKRTCEESLTRLKTDVIDLYYLHRWDKSVPIEDSVGALAELVAEGKIRKIGLSEVSAPTLRKAHDIHPISAVQNEYSLWTRNPEIALLDACAELGTAFVAFSPLGRGFLVDPALNPAEFTKGDIRRYMPRFDEPHLSANRKPLHALLQLADDAGVTPACLVLAWLLAKAPHIIPIPGTRSIKHLEEDVSAATIQIPADVLAQAGQIINRDTISGPRYNAATQAEIDTEQFA